MKYLLYYQNGFIRKFPLSKKVQSIGRGSNHDLVLDYEFISRDHLIIEIIAERVEIKDQNSVNGTFYNNKRVKKARLRLNDSFFLGGMEFILKEGDLQEFKASLELKPIFNSIKSDYEANFNLVPTKSMANAYVETLKEIIEKGLKKADFGSFIMGLPEQIEPLEGLDTLMLVSVKNGELIFHFSRDKDPELTNKVMAAIRKEKKQIFQQHIPFPKIKVGDCIVRCYPLQLAIDPALLIHAFYKREQFFFTNMEKFMTTLAKGIELIGQVVESGVEEALPVQKDDKPLKLLPNKQDQLIYASPGMRKLVEQVLVVAASDLFVLIKGESGTGKELFARLIHHHSSRKDQKFVALNCAAIPENLLESELFGYEKGAFTGAYQSQAGKFEMASGGTLVLDEIGDMPLNLQAKLLRVLQENEFYKLGGDRALHVDLRIISITNKNLKKAIQENRFRKDLYYRLVHHEFTVPPLRERQEDIPVLINHFSYYFCKKMNKTINGYSEKAFSTLRRYHWDGNIRQLKNEINRLVSLTPAGDMVAYEILSEDIKQYPEVNLRQKNEKEFLIELMVKHQWSTAKAAKELDLTYQGLYKKLKKLGIKKSPDE